MLNIFRSMLAILFILNLTSCLDVKDKSDEKVVDALTEQNKILQQQVNQVAEEKTTVTLTGVVKNISTDAKAVNATVKVKIGSTVSDPVDVMSGAFQIHNLPADSDYELIVHSTTDSFMDRTFFGKTRATNSPGRVYEDIGELDVAVGVEHKFRINNSVTNASISGLVLMANSNVGGGAGYEQYLHKSTYDATTQEYKITIPDRLVTRIYANLDVNNDGKAEYRSENNLYDSYLNIQDLSNHNTIYLVDLYTNAKIKVRISLVDSLLNTLSNASINVKDALNGTIMGSFDAATNQYVIEAVIDSSLNVMIPSFSVNGISYSSSSVQITKSSADETTYSVYVSGYRSYSTSFHFDAAADKVFDVVVQPSVLNNYSNISVVGTSVASGSSNTAFKVFYSGGVGVSNNSVSLLKKNVLHVVKGNESPTDLILPGTTLIESIDQSVPVDTQLSLGNTLLTATSKSPLEEGYTYGFSVAGLTDLFANLNADLYEDRYDLIVKSTGAFSINDIRLDNNDFYNNGVVIKPNNTAGNLANPYTYSWGSSVYLFLPATIENLKTLTLRKEQVITNNVTENDFMNFNVVTNGNVNNTGKSQVVSLAENENVTGNLSSVMKGTALQDGQWYSTYVYENMPDNTNTNVNSVTFSYAFETKAGVIETGTITLPVM